jgi:hypothetical protein
VIGLRRSSSQFKLGVSDTRATVDGVACRQETELLIACEEDRTLRAVLVGMLREAGRRD